MPDIDRFLRKPDVLRITGLSSSALYRRISDGTFPKQVKIGAKAVAWRQSEIAIWMSDPTASNGQSVH